MEAIKRQIFVLRDTLKDCIDYTLGTDMVPIEYHVMDFAIPATATAVVYVLRPDGDLDKILADVLDNVISFTPTKGFFAEGLNAIQIRIVNNNKALVSFTETVRVGKSMKFDDDAEAQQKTLIEQLLMKIGESDGNMKIERVERIAGDENEKAERNKAIAAEQKEREKEIDVERQRINNLAKLQEGSTTGDAELADVRVGADGKTYENAGEAVRGQVTALKEDLHMITSVGKNLFNPSTLVDGYLNSDGSIHENGIDMDWNTTNFIEVEPEKKLVTSKKSNDGIRRRITMFFLTEFDAGKKVIKHTTSPEKHVIDLLENSKFVRFSIHKAEINEIQTEQNNDMTAYEPYEKKVGKDNLSREFVEEFEALKRLKWQGKKWACLGDSLTEKNIRTTKHYHDYIAESTGIAVFNMGVGGTGYKRTEENHTAFYQRAAKIPVDCDVVTIFGSGNDLSLIGQLGTPTDVETTTICGCINKTIDEIIKIKPTVSLGIVSPTPWIGNQPTADDSNAMAKYTKALHDICKIRSIPFLDLYHCSNLRPWTSEGRNACYTKDDGNGVHPDENGHKLIAPRFKIFLEQLII